MTKNLCWKKKFGYCKYGDKCRNRHENVKCVTKNCYISDCEKRHPKVCIYYRDFGSCIFKTDCKYDHNKPKYSQENSDKIAELEKKIEQG